MTNSRTALAFRILAILFSVALATAYIACQGENPEQGKSDDPAVFPSTKSAPMDYNTGNFTPGEEEEAADEPAEPEADPVFLPGSKSAAFDLPSIDGPTKPKDARPIFTPEVLRKLEEQAKEEPAE